MMAKKIDPVEHLPQELVHSVFSFLDGRSLSCAAMVSKKWNACSDDNLLWKTLSKSTWNLSESECFTNTHQDWKRILRSSTMIRFVPNLNTVAGEECTTETTKKPLPMPERNTKALLNHLLKDSVVVTSSGVSQGNANTFLSREDAFCWTTNKENSWFRIDVGAANLVVPTHYALKYGSSANYCVPRNWKFQGSNDPNVEKDVENDALWTTLNNHENDTTLNSDFSWFVFPVDKCPTAYRYFRIVQTGPNAFVSNRPSPGALDSWSNVLVASGFDMFGLCIRVPPAPKMPVKKIGKAFSTEMPSLDVIKLC